jgi:hypothetical protein
MCIGELPRVAVALGVREHRAARAAAPSADDDPTAAAERAVDRGDHLRILDVAAHDALQSRRRREARRHDDAVDRIVEHEHALHSFVRDVDLRERAQLGVAERRVEIADSAGERVERKRDVARPRHAEVARELAGDHPADRALERVLARDARADHGHARALVADRRERHLYGVAVVLRHRRRLDDVASPRPARADQPLDLLAIHAHAERDVDVRDLDRAALDARAVDRNIGQLDRPRR